MTFDYVFNCFYLPWLRLRIEEKLYTKAVADESRSRGGSWKLVCQRGGNHLPSNNGGFKETMMLGDVIQNYYSVVLCIYCFIDIFLKRLQLNLMTQFSEGNGY